MIELFYSCFLHFKMISIDVSGISNLLKPIRFIGSTKRRN